MPGSVYTPCIVASLKVPAMIVYDEKTKVLGTKLFPQHNISDLNSGIAFIIIIIVIIIIVIIIIIIIIIIIYYRIIKIKNQNLQQYVVKLCKENKTTT